MSEFVRRYRVSGIFCALAVLVCELVSKPFTTMSFCDDGPYILMARTFAQTGHIIYNGWASAMIIAQLGLALPFIKLFGFSYTSTRMGTLFVAAVTAFFLQRLLVRTGASERNATLGTLTLGLSPMYLMLAGTFMSDIYGLFGVIFCLYGCVRALTAPEDRPAIGWIYFAVFICLVFGTSRQIAWLGDLIMVPSTLWLLHFRRRLFLQGLPAAMIGVLLIFACMHWYSRQPYAVIVPFKIGNLPVLRAIHLLTNTVLEVPFLVLPVIAVFIPEIRKSRRWIVFALGAGVLAYLLAATLMRVPLHGIVNLEPTAGGEGSWITGSTLEWSRLDGAPIFLHTKYKFLLTIASIGGLAGVIAVIVQVCQKEIPFHSQPETSDGEGLTWKQLTYLLLPFSIVYLLFLLAAANTTRMIFDRYALCLAVPALIVLIRLYQEQVRPNLPRACTVLIGVMAAYAVMFTYNAFALERARVAIADELNSQGIPSIAIDGGWDYNVDTELHYSSHLNYPLIKIPADAYIPQPPAPPGTCDSGYPYLFPHIHATYGISFNPEFCHGLAPFAPVQYRPWPSRKPVYLYAVRYAPLDNSDSTRASMNPGAQ